jgi:acetyl-CoA acetyltransferase
MSVGEDSIRDRSAIVGIGQTEYSRSSGRSEASLCLEAIRRALDDAGLDAKDVDGLVRFGASQTNCSEAWIAHNLGVESLAYWCSIDPGGGASAALLAHASMAVSTGQADVVVCYRALNGSSGRRPGTSDTMGLFAGQDPQAESFLHPNGLTAPVQFFALIAQRHMFQFGTTHEQLAQISVTFREAANRNPRAQMHKVPLSLDECATADLISDPLRKFDCCLQTDGAAAFIVTTPERARDLAQKPVFVKSAGQALGPEQHGALFSAILREDVTEWPSRRLATDVYARSGLGPSDIDVAQLYDCFTITALIQLEDYGFCGRGEGGPFVESGALSLGGVLPCNTAGGNLSEGYLHGVNHVLEATRQLRGTSTSQVESAEVALVTGGTPTPTSAAILGNVHG